MNEQPKYNLKDYNTPALKEDEMQSREELVVRLKDKHPINPDAVITIRVNTLISLLVAARAGQVIIDAKKELKARKRRR